MSGQEGGGWYHSGMLGSNTGSNYSGLPIDTDIINYLYSI